MISKQRLDEIRQAIERSSHVPFSGDTIPGGVRIVKELLAEVERLQSMEKAVRPDIRDGNLMHALLEEPIVFHVIPEDIAAALGSDIRSRRTIKCPLAIAFSRAYGHPCEVNDGGFWAIVDGGRKVFLAKHTQETRVFQWRFDFWKQAVPGEFTIGPARTPSPTSPQS